MTHLFLRTGLVRSFKEALGAFVLLAALFVPTAFAVAAGDDGAMAWLKVGDDPSAALEQRSEFRRRPTEYEQYRKTQAALIKSPEVLRGALNNPAIEKLKLVLDQAKPEEWLKENLSVAFPLESEVLQVSLKANNREEAAKIVNAVVESYLTNIVEAERQQINKHYDLLDRQFKELKAELAQKQEQLAELSLRTGGDPATIGVARERLSKVLSLLADVDKKLYETELQAIASRIRAEESEAGAAEKRQAKTELSIAEAQIKFLREKQQQLKEELEKWTMQVSGREHTEVATLREEIKRKQALLRDSETKLARLSLLAKMPPRVTLLMQATPE